MQSAKSAVKGFLSKDGKHDTTVHESVNPHVTNENVTRTQHENVTQAVDREVHQHHHHTTVQPIHDKEVLPEKHVHQAADTEHREFHHGNDSNTKDRLTTEAAQFKDNRTVGDVQHSSSAAPIVGSEHHHHHVHETVQPVIHKETVQPTVIHTTKPIHETHHAEAQHHGTTTLPPVTMAEFKQQGGHLGSHNTRTDAFAGEPNLQGRHLGGQGAAGTTSLTQNEQSSHGPLSGNGQHSNSGAPAVGSGVDNVHNTGGNHGLHGTNGSTGVTGSNTNTTGNHNTTTGDHKESLITKIKKAL
jgi:hypothetical protein